MSVAWAAAYTWGDRVSDWGQLLFARPPAGWRRWRGRIAFPRCSSGRPARPHVRSVGSRRDSWRPRPERIGTASPPRRRPAVPVACEDVVDRLERLYGTMPRWRSVRLRGPP